MSSSFSTRHEHQSSFKLTVYFQFSSVHPCGKLKMKYSAKVLRQLMSSSFSCRHVCSFVLPAYFYFQVYVYSENSKWQTLRSFVANSCQVASVVFMYASLVSNWQIFFFSSVHPFWILKMTDPAKFLSQFMSSSISSVHVLLSIFESTDLFSFSKCTSTRKIRNDRLCWVFKLIPVK